MKINKSSDRPQWTPVVKYCDRTMWCKYRDKKKKKNSTPSIINNLASGHGIVSIPA